MANVWQAVEEYLGTHGASSLRTLHTACGASVGASTDDTQEVLSEMLNERVVIFRNGKYELNETAGMAAEAPKQIRPAPTVNCAAPVRGSSVYCKWCGREGVVGGPSWPYCAGVDCGHDLRGDVQDERALNDTHNRPDR